MVTLPRVFGTQCVIWLMNEYKKPLNVLNKTEIIMQFQEQSDLSQCYQKASEIFQRTKKQTAFARGFKGLVIGLKFG